MAARPSVSSFSLEEFVKHHELPCTVMVTRGYSCGEADEEESLSNGEVITLHSVQQGQVVKAKDHLGRSVALPVVHCGRKYELLTENSDQDNIIYETLLDMISDPNMPNKVRVTVSVDSGDDDSTIYANDILEVVTVKGSSRPNFGSDQRCLVMKNQLDETLELPLSTPGKFSPQLDVKWYSMAELVTNFNFPLRVHLVSAHPGQRVHGHNKFTLLSKELETNVLATVNKELIAISSTADVEVAPRTEELDLVVDLPPPPPQDNNPPLLVLNDGEDEQSLADSSSVKSAFPEPSSPAGEGATGFEDNFTISPRSSHLLSLSESDRIKVRIGSVRKFGSVKSLTDVDELSESGRPERMIEIFEQLQDKTAECIRLREDANKLQARCQRIESQAHTTRKKMTEAERMATFWRDRLEQTQKIDDAILEELEKYCRNPSPPEGTQPQGDFGKVPPPVAPKTKVAVAPQVSSKPSAPITADTLSRDQVLKLLKALNMSQYCTNFEEEQVDGGLLLELDEKSLEEDLGIKSSLHRKKLLRTIQGKSAALAELLK